jgi:glycosyltransferase involved in cell wall biosynthesis
MKILIIINNLSSGGAEKIIKDFIFYAKNHHNNITIEVLMLNGKKSVYAKDLSRIGIKILDSNLSLYNPIQIVRIAARLYTGKYDIVHVHLFPASYLTILAKFLFFSSKTKFIYTEHSSNNRKRKYFFFKLLDTLIFKSYDEITFVSESARQNHFKWVKTFKLLAKYPIVINGIDFDLFYNAQSYDLKSELGISSNLPIKFITMVGRFTEAKDQNTLIRSLLHLPINYHVIFLGDGHLINLSKKLSESLYLSNRVHFLGFKKDCERYIKGSFLTCLSSNWEGLSLFSLEAMASGIPFIGSNVPGITENVIGPEILFNNGNFVELANLIVKFESLELYKSVAKKGIEKAKNYSLESMTNKYIEIYRLLYEN